jgi:FAD:protein FMN transferase
MKYIQNLILKLLLIGAIAFCNICFGNYKLIADDSLRYEINVEKSLLGTEITGKVISSDIKTAKKALYFAFKEIERIDSLYDYSSSNSIVFRLNNFAYSQPVKIDNETYELLERAIEYSKLYSGYFDVSLGALTDLWGFSKDAEIQLPTKNQIDSLIKSVGYNNIILDSVNQTCRYTKPDLKIDFGGIAKGYAVDQAAKILDSFGIEDYIVNAGGDLTAKGKNKNNKNWVIGIKHPRMADTIVSAFSALDSKTSVASSGDYERFKIINGVRYHHILNPFTGYCENKCQSVTVIDSSTESATVLAKYIFLIGADAFLILPLSKETKYFIVNSDGNIITNFNQ